MAKIDITKIAHFSGHKGSIFSLCKGLDPETFFSGADDGFVVEWNHHAKGDGHLLVQVNRPVYSLFLHNQSKRLFCGTAAGNLHVIDLIQRKEIRNIEAHTKGLYDIQQMGETILTVGGDGNINCWDLDTLSLKHSIQASNKSARVIAVHPDGSHFSVGFSDYFIRNYSTASFQLLHEWPAHSNSVFALSYSPDGLHLYSGGRDVMLKSWDNKNKNKLNIPAHNLHINAIAFSPDTKLFATVSMDKTLKIWDTATDTLLKVVDKPRNDGHITSVNKLLWLNDYELLTCSDDRTIMMWKIDYQSSAGRV